MVKGKMVKTKADPLEKDVQKLVDKIDKAAFTKKRDGQNFDFDLNLKVLENTKKDQTTWQTNKPESGQLATKPGRPVHSLFNAQQESQQT